MEPGLRHRGSGRTPGSSNNGNYLIDKQKSDASGCAAKMNWPLETPALGNGSSMSPATQAQNRFLEHRSPATRGFAEQCLTSRAEVGRRRPFALLFGMSLHAASPADCVGSDFSVGVSNDVCFDHMGIACHTFCDSVPRHFRILGALMPESERLDGCMAEPICRHVLACRRHMARKAVTKGDGRHRSRRPNGEKGRRGK